AATSACRWRAACRSRGVACCVETTIDALTAARSPTQSITSNPNRAADLTAGKTSSPAVSAAITRRLIAPCANSGGLYPVNPGNPVEHRGWCVESTETCRRGTTTSPPKAQPWLNLPNAAVAQWKSSSVLRKGLGVRVPPAAPLKTVELVTGRV
ncbi:MAG: hypothetical protein RLZZ441_586, partial [Actinomycetota bacterium]